MKICLLFVSPLPKWLEGVVKNLSKALARHEEVEIVENDFRALEFFSKERLSDAPIFDGVIVILTSQESTDIGMSVGYMLAKGLSPLILHERNIPPSSLIEDAHKAGHLTLSPFVLGDFVKLFNACRSYIDRERMKLEGKICDASLSESIEVFDSLSAGSQPSLFSETGGDPVGFRFCQ